MSKIQNCGFISLLYSIGDKPLSLWSKYISPDGRVRRVTDETLNGDKVIELTGPHDVPVCTHIACPSNPMEVLNIKLPILVLIIKKLDLKFKFEFQILDKKRYRRKFTFTTFEGIPIINVTAAQLPLKLEKDWNNLEINLQTLCQEIFGTDYEVLQRIIIYPNCCLRRIYMQDRHYKHDETPVELCQAFFDMYMLKWGIYLVDKSSQTEESNTGPLQPCDLAFVSNKSKASIPKIPKTSIALYNVSKQKENKFFSCSHMLEKDKLITKPNSKSVNELDSKGKIKKNTNKENVNKLKNESRDDKPNDKEKKVTESPSVYLNETNVPPPKALLNFSHFEKSKYLKMIESPFLNKLDKEGNIFSKWPYKFEKLNREIKSVPTINDNIKNKLSSIPDNPDRDSDEQNILTFPTKQSFLKVKNTDFRDQNVRNIKNIIDEVQKIKEQINNKSYNLKSEVKVENPSDSVIPYFIELEAKPSEKKSKSKLLTSDEIVNDFLKSRFVANKKMFERLREKGLTMTEVELSIYNSKNRRNCYGQGKLIESCRGSVNKATNFGVIKSLDTDKLNNGNLHNCDNSTKLKKELDVILFPYQDSTQKASSTQLFTISEAIGIEEKVQTVKDSSKKRRASVNYF